MDPEAVVANARGTIDEALLTRTRGGFLGRNVLADRPLIDHLDEAETLQYLLAGPAPPEKHQDDTHEVLDVEGSYRTLLAVTTRRLLIVAGSADGDRSLSLPYRLVGAVDHRAGLLTDTVAVETLAGVTWTVSVKAGSDVAAAVSYARDLLPEDDVARRAALELDPDEHHSMAPEPVDDADSEGDESGEAADRDATTAQQSGSAASTSDGDGFDLLGGGGEEVAGAGSDAAGEPTVEELMDVSTDRSGEAIGSSGRASDEQWDDGRATEAGGRATGGAGTEPELVDAMFEYLVRVDAVPRVEQYESDDLEALVDDLAAHRQRLREHLDAGDADAARGAAATVDALAAEGERIARTDGDADLARQIASVRAEVRRTVVRDALDVEDAALDGGLESLVGRVLGTLDTAALAQVLVRLWDALSYQTAVTGDDSTVDVVARRSTPVEQTVGLRVARAGEEGPVGLDAVEQAARRRDRGDAVDVLVLVTAGEFDAEARQGASDADVKLLDGERLAELVVDRDHLDLVIAALRA